MPIHNAEIADIFTRMADLLEIQGANPFRVRAYRTAARTISDLPQSAAEMVARDEDLSQLSGIGKDLAGKIAEIVKTGGLANLAEVEKETPPALTQLMKIAGLGPKRVAMLHRELGIRDLHSLREAVQAGRIRELPGFGEKTEEAISEKIGRLTAGDVRIRLAIAQEIAGSMVQFLKQIAGVKQVVPAGSLRRLRETVRDIDILATCIQGSPVMERFVNCEDAAEVVSFGDTRSTIVLRSGLHVDLRVVPEISYGAALHYFTGSKAHNIAIRKLGVKKGLRINEYGVFAGGKRVAGKTEEEVFAAVDLPFIPPEIREDRGEVEAAREGRLPQLVELADIRGDLHAHTDATDGRNTLAEMAAAARNRGYGYLAISDHSQRLSMAHGFDPRRLAVQIEAIDQLNEDFEGFHLLKSCEVDILEDGTLDLPDEILKRLDLTVCSVHSKFRLPLREQTERVIRAMDNRYCTIIGHPTGRLIGSREPYEVDMERLLAAARERGCFIELNAQPERLDLNDIHCRTAKEIGVLVAISTDAHSIVELEAMRHGIAQARRGWLAAKDILNTRETGDLLTLIKRRR